MIGAEVSGRGTGELVEVVVSGTVVMAVVEGATVVSGTVVGKIVVSGTLVSTVGTGEAVGAVVSSVGAVVDGGSVAVVEVTSANEVVVACDVVVGNTVDVVEVVGLVADTETTRSSITGPYQPAQNPRSMPPNAIITI